MEWDQCSKCCHPRCTVFYCGTISDMVSEDGDGLWKRNPCIFMSILFVGYKVTIFEGTFPKRTALKALQLIGAIGCSFLSLIFNSKAILFWIKWKMLMIYLSTAFVPYVMYSVTTTVLIRKLRNLMSMFGIMEVWYFIILKVNKCFSGVLGTMSSPIM